MADSLRKAKATISAQFEFTPSGYLKSVLVNCETTGDQAVVERALVRLIRPGHFGWIRRLFTKPAERD